MKNNNCVINIINAYQIILLKTLEYSKQEKTKQKGENEQTNPQKSPIHWTYDGENDPLYSPTV